MTLTKATYSMIEGAPANVLDFGAVGDGVTDDTAAIQAAIDSSDSIYFPPGTYKVSATLNVNADNKNIFGSGIGVSVLENHGSGNIFSISSLGGVSPTIVGGKLSDLELNGNGTGQCLKIYDVAQFRVERVKSCNSTAYGFLCEMIVDCSLINCVSIDNAVDGFALLDSSKNSVEFNTNAIQIYGCVAYGNGSAGLKIRRSRGNVVIGGEFSGNDYNVLIDGGERNTLCGLWVENATTRALQINESTSGLGVLYSGDGNKITDCMLSTGAGLIEIVNGDSNFFQSNYIGVDLNIAVTASRTYLGPQAGLTGNINDLGSGTINLSDSTTQYYKASGAKRLEIDIGSTVDFKSDIQAFRFGQIKGISSSSTLNNNFTGYVDITGSATSSSVTFATPETDSGYGVLFGVWHVAGTPASGSESVYMTSRATTGFTINLKAAPGTSNTVRVQWLLVR